MQLNEKVLGLLNTTGYPFQHYCSQVISNLDGFQVSVEVPFTDPPSNGPLIGAHGQIDILACCPDRASNVFVCFVIECKRANEKIKNWVFLRNHQQDPRWPTFVMSMTTGDNSGSSPQLQIFRNVRFPALGYSELDRYDYCVNGLEINQNLSSINRDQSEKIYKPMVQVIHASHAFETMHPKIIEGIDYLRQESGKLVLHLPVIVTTAELYLADFDPALVQKGDIQPGDLNFGSPRSWISYEFPLPDYLSYGLNRPGEGQTVVAKRTVFVVNYQSLTDFFVKACSTAVSGNPPVRSL